MNCITDRFGASSTLQNFEEEYNGGMLDSQDIQKLTELLATKEDFRGIETRLDGIDTRLDVMDGRLDGIDTRLDGIDGRLINVESQLITMSQAIVSLDDRMTVMEEKQDVIISILDKISLRLDALQQEYLVLKERDSRYERWFHQIAEKVGISLVP